VLRTAGIALLFVIGVSEPTVAAAENQSDMRIVLLGTAGGPAIKRSRAQPASAVVVNDNVYIIDAGDGVARQMALADLSPLKLRAVFITHLHSDHVADYGTLLLRAWLSGLKHPVDTFGPPPLVAMTVSWLEFMDWDIQLRIRDEARVPLSGLIRPREFNEGGVIFDDGVVKVTAFLVEHDAAKPAFGYRFDTPDKSIVFSGDTAFSQRLIEMSRGVDILVHEVVSIPGAEAVVQKLDPGNEQLLRHIVDAHTPAVEVGQIAAQADVAKLVLTHLTPSGMPGIDEPEVWLKDVRKHYSGEVIVGEDLLVIR